METSISLCKKCLAKYPISFPQCPYCFTNENEKEIVDKNSIIEEIKQACLDFEAYENAMNKCYEIIFNNIKFFHVKYYHNYDCGNQFNFSLIKEDRKCETDLEKLPKKNLVALIRNHYKF